MAKRFVLRIINIIDVFFILFILSFSDLRISSVYADSFSVVFCQHSIYVLRMRTILLCPITFVVFLIKMGVATHRIYGAI